jgi:hypothetical protein
VSLPRQTSWEEVVRRFRALGWTGPWSGAKHPFTVKGTRKQRIPNPHDSDVGVPLLKEILRQAGITADEWNDAL